MTNHWSSIVDDLTQAKDNERVDLIDLVLRKISMSILKICIPEDMAQIFQYRKTCLWSRSTDTKFHGSLDDPLFSRTLQESAKKASSSESKTVRGMNLELPEAC